MTTVAARNSLVLVLALVMAQGCNSTPTEQQRMGQGLTYHQDGRWEQAKMEYSEVLQIRTNPVDQAEVFYNLGQIYEKSGLNDQAKSFYQAAISNYGAKAAKRAEAHMALGALLFGENKFDLARDQFQQATEFAPTDFKPYYNLGIAYEALGRPAEAIKAYQKALDLRPDSGLAHLSLAFIHENSGEIDKARFHHSYARRYGVDDAVLVDRLTWWNEWQADEVTAVRAVTTRDKKIEGKLSVLRPRMWRIGSAAQSGTTIARTVANTAATVIGEQSAVQIIGPFNEVTYSRKGTTQSLREYAEGALLLWLEGNLPEVHKDLTAGKKPLPGAEQPGGGESGGGETPKPAEASEIWEVDRVGDPEDQNMTVPVMPKAVSFVNGATGVVLNLTHTDKDKRKRNIRIYYYVGDKNSYLILTTRETDDRRIVHALDYLALNVSELTTK